MKNLLLASIVAASISAQASMLDTIPFFWAVTGKSAAYQDAAFQAQKAFFLQSGISPEFDAFLGRNTKRVETTTMRYIDNSTPMSSKVVAGTAAVGYAIATKHVSMSFANPLLPILHNTVDVSRDSASLGLQFTF